MSQEPRRSGRVTRRQFLAGGAGVAAAGVPPALGSATSPESGETDDHRLERDATPTSATLHDVATTDAGTFAVGNGGTVVRRGEERWHAVAFDPEVDLVGASADGTALWVAGRDGSIRRFDPQGGSVADRSPPTADSATLTDLTVPGRSAGPTIYATDRSGSLHWSSDGGRSWQRRKPAGGASLTAVDHHCPCTAHAVDTNGNVISLRRHHGEGPLRTRVVGVDGASVDFYGVVSHGHIGGMMHGGHGGGSTSGHRHGSPKHGGVTVVGGSGTVYFTHAGGWRRLQTGTDTLRGVVAHQNGSRGEGVAVGDSGLALAFRFPTDGDPQVRRFSTPVGSSLRAATPSPDGKSEYDLVAVGSGGVALDT